MCGALSPLSICIYGVVLTHRDNNFTLYNLTVSRGAQYEQRATRVIFSIPSDSLSSACRSTPCELMKWDQDK
jgi:hypothetical protein